MAKGRKKKFKGHKLVVKSNALVQTSRTTLGLAEMRAFSFFLAQINEPSAAKIVAGGEVELTFNKAEFCEMCGIEKGNGGNNRYLKETIKRLSQSTFEIERGIEGQPGYKWEVMTVLNYAALETMPETNETLTVTFNRRIVPYLFNLKSNFTTYQLGNVMELKSKHAFRLYEFFKSFNTRTITLYFGKIQKLLGVKYESAYELIRKVVEPALKDINRKTDLYISFEKIYTNGAITSIMFLITPHSEMVEVKEADVEIDDVGNNFVVYEDVEQLKLDI